MESLIAKVERVKVTPGVCIDMNKDELYDLLNKVTQVKKSYLADAVEYYRKLVGNIDNIKLALVELKKLLGNNAHPDKYNDLVTCIIIKQQVMSKFSCTTKLLDVMFPKLIWTVGGGGNVKQSLSGDTVFCVGIMFDEPINVDSEYKSILSRQGYPTLSSFLVKILYNINMCMRLFDKVSVENMTETMKLISDTIDVSNVSINVRYT